MDNKSKDIFRDVNELFEVYPILKEINEKNNCIINNKIIISKLSEGQYLSSVDGECSGILFVISGVIKIQKINEDGDETNLYNIKKGNCAMKH